MLCLELVFSFLIAITAVNAELKPSLQIEPSGKILTRQVGNKLALTCKAKVEDPGHISNLEWKDFRNETVRIANNNGSPLSLQKVVGDPGLVLIFNSLTENQAGTYTCTAMYANTEPLQTSVTVSTYVGITFDEAPESQYPPVGSTDYLIKCKVKGNPTPLVDWSKNDVPITANDSLYVMQNDGLIIKKVKESDDGVYKCRAVVFSTGDIKEKNIKVEVIVPPVIQKMKDVEVIEGQTASVKCVATGKPPPTYQWIKQRESKDLSKTDRFDVKQNTGDLIINRVEWNDDGDYTCVATNKADRAESSVKINVLVKPKIFELLNVTAPVNSSTKLICKTEGRPLPEVIFRKLSNKEPFTVGQQSDQRIIVEQEYFKNKNQVFGTLIVSKLERSDDGLYECIAENQAGTSYKNGHITVEFAPTFERTKNLTDFWTWRDHLGNLSCIPEAIPNATIIWKKNNIEISPNNQAFQIIGKGPTSNLIVKASRDKGYHGRYECIATNKHGTTILPLQLKEAQVPQQVNQIKAHSITATTIKFNIVPPAYFANLPIRSFIVQYKPSNQLSDWHLARNRTWAFNSPYILEDLTPEMAYHFRFAATNDVGIGPWTDSQSITMPKRSEPAEPKIYMPKHSIQEDNTSTKKEKIAISPYADHFELRWYVPNDNGDPIDSYLIRYCVIKKVNGQWQDSDCSGEIKQSVQYTSYELNTLQPDTYYKIELRAHNAIGSSLPAQIRIKTARGIDPAVPYNEPAVTNFAIIGIVVAAVILLLVFVDLICFCVNRAGILAFICDRNKSKHHEEDPKLGSLYSWRFPLPYCSYKAAPAHPNSLNLPLPVKLAPSPVEEREPLKPDTQPINGERNMSVEFDGKHVYSKTGEIIGKHSAV